MEEERLEASKKFSGKEETAEGRVRLLRARGSAELVKVSPGSATQGLWLRNRKVRSQVSGVDRSRFPGKGTVEEEEEPATERRRGYIDLGLDLSETEEQVVCHASVLALAMTDEARRNAEM